MLLLPPHYHPAFRPRPISRTASAGPARRSRPCDSQAGRFDLSHRGHDHLHKLVDALETSHQAVRHGKPASEVDIPLHVIRGVSWRPRRIRAAVEDNSSLWWLKCARQRPGETGVRALAASLTKLSLLLLRCCCRLNTWAASALARRRSGWTAYSTRGRPTCGSPRRHASLTPAACTHRELAVAVERVRAGAPSRSVCWPASWHALPRAAIGPAPAPPCTQSQLPRPACTRCAAGSTPPAPPPTTASATTWR